jgi:oxalate decarboxylase
LPPITSQSPETAAPVAPQASLALVATFVAGLLDAVGFVQLSGLFVSFMSGNSTHLGMSLARADWAAVLAALGVVGAFSAGALGGTLAYDAASPDWRLRLVLLGELVLVLLAMGLVVLGQATAGLALVAFAMGWQNLVHRSVAGADIGRSFITGALFGLGQAGARAIRGTGPVGAVWAYGAAWLAFVIGAAAGALILMRLGLIEALAVAATLVAVLLLLVLRFRV